jgi:hypothetical protein
MPEINFWDLWKRLTNWVFDKHLKYNRIFFNKRLNSGGGNSDLESAQ